MKAVVVVALQLQHPILGEQLKLNHYLVWMSFFLVLFWLRIHRYRREQIAAEQERMQQAATPPDGVWPPPPQSPV